MTCQVGVGSGDPCLRYDDHSNCLEGECVSDAGTPAFAAGTCAPLGQLGSACGNSDNGLPRCDFCFDCLNGTCAERGKAGARCTSDTLCLDTDF